jgi:hypothetical protein
LDDSGDGGLVSVLTAILPPQSVATGMTATMSQAPNSRLRFSRSV